MTLDRATRMVDISLEEALITFDLAEEPTEAEIEAAKEELEKLQDEKRKT